MSKEHMKSEQDNYTVEINYTPEATEKKLIKFTATSEDNSFEIDVDKIIELISLHVNMDKLSPVFVDTEAINMVSVNRTLNLTVERDIEKGEEITINYSHPYPVEFALLEELYKIAKIDESTPAITISKEFIEEHRSKIHPDNEKFVKSIYSQYMDKDLRKNFDGDTTEPVVTDEEIKEQIEEVQNGLGESS